MSNPTTPSEIVGIAPGSSVALAPGTTIAATPTTATTPTTLTYPSSGVFQGQGVWMLGPTITVPAGAKSISFDCGYQGTGPTSQVQFRIRRGHTSGTMHVEPVDDTTLTVSGAVGTQNECDRVRDRPVSGASAVGWDVDFNVAEWPFVAVDFAEAVQDVAGAGTMSSVTWVASFA